LAALHAQEGADLVGQGLIGRAAEDLELIVPARPLRLGLALRLLHLLRLFRCWCYCRHGCSLRMSWFATSDCCSPASICCCELLALAAGPILSSPFVFLRVLLAFPITCDSGDLGDYLPGPLHRIAVHPLPPA